MKNLDAIQQKKEEAMQNLQQAMKENDDKAFAQAWSDYTESLTEAVMSEAKGLVQASDNNVLIGRGVRTLTSNEKQYYSQMTEAMRSTNPRQALSLIDEALPTTVIDSIMEDLKEAHPLLEEINFQNTGILTEILVSTYDGRFKAIWGPLTGKITEEISSGLAKINLDKKKLSAFIPISKPMLEIGPEWIDRYVRAILGEAIANGLENGIINGTGVDSPVGMTKNPNGDFNSETGYPDLVALPITKVTPATYGTIIGGLAVGRNGNYRDVGEVLVICNPVDYYTKVMPAVMHKNPDGTWTSRWPFPTKVIRSIFVPSNKAIIGLGKRYFFGLGTAKDGKIEYSDDFKFLDDVRVYLTKLYGEGKPLDNTSFAVLDITNLAPIDPRVEVANWPDATDPMEVAEVTDTRLASLAIGSLTLSPAFNKDTKSYTAPTTNASNAINAVAMFGEAAIEIKNGETTVANHANATWVDGENIVTIKVTAAGQTETYTVVVTKS